MQKLVKDYPSIKQINFIGVLLKFTSLEIELLNIWILKRLEI